MLIPAVLFPQMFGKDPYDIDSGWRPTSYVIALEGENANYASVTD